MRIRSLVPALACLAAAPLATAAEPSVKIDGFVDSILSGSSVIDSSPGDPSESNTEFSYAAKLGFTAAISDKVSAKVDAVISGNAATGSTGSNTDTNQINVRQAFGTWKLTPEVELKTGKFIGDYGWVAAYSPQLYRVNGGPITAFYGVSQVGGNLKYSKDSIAAALTVANGFFSEGNNGAQSASGQSDQSFAYGVDVVFILPGDKGSVNVEAVYDLDASTAVGVAKGGDGMHLGLNATLKPSEPLTLGAELIIQQVGTADGAPATNDDQEHLGALGTANFKVPGCPWKSSVTGMVQYVSVSNENTVKDTDSSSLELSLAWLTYPAGTDGLGMNFEVSYTTAEEETATPGSKTETDTVAGAAELLYVF